MLRSSCWIASLLLWGTIGWASAGELSIGDPAPPLDLKEFIKGKPVAIEKGRVYVIEFWATWCGPCVESIPHLTKLQEKHKNIHIIGISDEDAATVKPFVEKMGDKMDYRVAIDKPAGAAGNAKPDKQGAEESEGRTARAWMDASGQSGIPTAFIVGREGRIAWLGHPIEMDKVLEEVVAGTFDLQAAAKEYKEKQTLIRKLRDLRTRIAEAQRDGGDKAVLKLLDEAILDSAKLEPTLGLHRFALLCKDQAKNAEAVEYGRRLVDRVVRDDFNALGNLAWLVVQPETPKPTPALAKLALQAALRADALAERKDANTADTLARAYFVNGNAKKAVETQERALKLAVGTPLQGNPELKDRLEEYRKANQ